MAAPRQAVVSPEETDDSSRTEAVLASLGRQAKRVRRHSSEHDWEPMLEAIDRLDAIAQSARSRLPATDAAVTTFLEQELAELGQHFAQIRHDLEGESQQIRETRHKLRSVREFSPFPRPEERIHRLNVSA